VPLPTTTTRYLGGRTYNVTAELNIRTGPGTTYPQVGQVPQGTSVLVACTTSGEVTGGPYGPTNKWDRISYGGITGFVTDEYVDTKDDIFDRSRIPLC
jgi:uncharacterized protein YraI